MKQSRAPPGGSWRANDSRRQYRLLDQGMFIHTPPQAAEREVTKMTQKAALFVRSATSDPRGREPLRAREKAGRAFARTSGLRITRTWAVKARTPLEDRRAFRSFVKGVKGDPSIKVLLFERPEGIWRRPRDLVTLHDLARQTGKEIRFFGSDHEMTACLHFEIMARLIREALACDRERSGGETRSTSSPAKRAGERR